MGKAIVCGDCGVPLQISRELRWESNGVISLARSPQSRMILYESNIIDNLFKGIEELIGRPVEHIVIESRRREARRYMEKRFPAPLRRAFMRLEGGIAPGSLMGKIVRPPLFGVGKMMATRVISIGRVYGYGDSKLGDLWGSGERYPWRNNIIRFPYSLPFWVAEAIGSAEAFDGMDEWARYERIDDATYRVQTYPSSHPVELGERLQRRRCAFKPGDIEFERCPSCGVPKEVARLKWDLDKGTIHDPDLNRRMAIYGPSALEAVLDDLEAELGEAIPEVVIEAQRRYVKSRVSGDNWVHGGITFNRLTAMRGMGNLTRFEVDEHHLELTIQNSCLPLVMVGMAQAIYELALKKEKTAYEWELAGDGDLEIAIKA